MTVRAAATRKPPRRRARRGTGEQLRTEIVAATKDLLAASGSSEAVSIRAVAEAVGVTPPSIYLHFADKDELIAAVVVDVFAELDEAMMKAGVEATGPLDRLRAFGVEYVKFAVAHPEHYRVATMERCVPNAAGDDPAGAQTGRADMDKVLTDGAFTHFMATVTDCMAAGIFTAGDPVPVTLQLWSAAHGIASLMISKPYLPWGDVETTANSVLRAAALGHATAELLGRPDPEQMSVWLTSQARPS